MKEQLSKLGGIVFPFLLVTNIVLIYQINKLPSEMAKIAGKPAEVKKDTVVKTITAKLQNSKNFIYFQGKIIGESFKMKDSYTYNIKYPSEVYEGFLTHVVANDNGEYFVWSKSEINKSTLSKEFKGWFFTDGLASFQLNDEKKYLQLLYPVVEKK